MEETLCEVRDQLSRSGVVNSDIAIPLFDSLLRVALAEVSSCPDAPEEKPDRVSPVWEETVSVVTRTFNILKLFGPLLYQEAGFCTDFHIDSLSLRCKIFTPYLQNVPNCHNPLLKLRENLLHILNL